MSGVNKVIVLGRLGTDPDVKTMDSGTTLANLNVATSDAWTDKDGKRQERTEWHRVSVWGKQAELCGKYLTKGRQVYIEGSLHTRSYEKDGEKRYATDIKAHRVQFLGGEKASDAKATQSFGQEPNFDEHEEIPF